LSTQVSAKHPTTDVSAIARKWLLLSVQLRNHHRKPLPAAHREGVVGAQARLADVKGALVGGLRGREVALLGQDTAEGSEVGCDFGMLWAVGGLVDRQGALVQGAGAVEVALVVQDGGEVVEAVGGVGVVGAQAGLAERQGALVQGAGAVEVALGGQDAGEVVEALRG